MKLLLDQGNSDSDKSFLNLTQNITEYKLPEGARGLPNWAPSNSKNARGVCPITSCHYLALAKV